VRVARRDAVGQLGARWVPTPQAVAGTCDVILTVLPGIAELRDLVTGSGALLAGVRTGAIWVDHTSASVELGRDLAGHAEDADIRYLDAPLGEGVGAMQAGAVTLYVGGDREAFADAEPILRSYAQTIHHVGDAGSGYLAKLLINLLGSRRRCCSACFAAAPGRACSQRSICLPFSGATT
jgi:3-hydroxyisobutyrate dehydrogenase